MGRSLMNCEFFLLLAELAARKPVGQVAFLLTGMLLQRFDLLGKSKKEALTGIVGVFVELLIGIMESSIHFCNANHR